jgi:uncharacterized protein YbjT (DUF2867 family)
VSPPTIGRFSFNNRILRPINGLRYTRQPSCIIRARLQPVYVEDVAEAVVRILRVPATLQVYELAGPRVYTYQELLRAIAASEGTKPFLVPVPFSLWHVIGYVAEALSSPPLTRNQVELMGQDNISKPDAPGFEALQISPGPIEIMLSA